VDRERKRGGGRGSRGEGGKERRESLTLQEMKLGEENTFYFNEELKMWVEKGKEEEYAKKQQGPPPPPTDSELKKKPSM
jgi:hypothetical protein